MKLLNIVIYLISIKKTLSQIPCNCTNSSENDLISWKSGDKIMTQLYKRAAGPMTNLFKDELQ